MNRIGLYHKHPLRLLTVCLFLFACCQLHAKNLTKEEAKQPVKLKKLKLSKEQLKKDEEVKKRHSKEAVKNYKVLDYMKLKQFTVKLGFGFLTDNYDDHSRGKLWEHNTLKSPVLNLGFYMHHHFNYCKFHLFHGLDFTYLESIEEIANGKVKLITKGFLISPEVGVTFHPSGKQWFGFSGSFKIPLIRKTETELKTATYTKGLDDEVGTYEVGLWAHWYASPEMRPYLRYSFGEDSQNVITGGFFYGFQ